MRYNVILAAGALGLALGMAVFNLANHPPILIGHSLCLAGLCP